MIDSARPRRAAHPETGREISGRWVILGIAAFAITVTTTLYVYWYLHRAPFLALQQAIAAEYEGSRPLVEGGQHKMHRGGVSILRIVVEVTFDPNAEEHLAAVDGIADRLVELAREHQPNIADYERLDVHLFQQERERQLHEHTVEVDLETGDHEHIVHDPRVRTGP